MIQTNWRSGTFGGDHQSFGNQARSESSEFPDNSAQRECITFHHRQESVGTGTLVTPEYVVYAEVCWQADLIFLVTDQVQHMHHYLIESGLDAQVQSTAAMEVSTLMIDSS